MNNNQPPTPNSRVFIVGLGNLEVVYLAASGQIVSRVPGVKPLPEERRLPETGDPLPDERHHRMP